MLHHEDDEIIGLTRALQKLPTMFRVVARQEFRQAFLKPESASFGKTEIIFYKSRGGLTLSKALLIIVECENFVFDLFFVPDRKCRLVPVVGRAYCLPTNSLSLIN